MIVTDGQQGDAHDHGVVAQLGRLDRELPDARPREQRLDEQRAGDQRRQAQARAPSRPAAARCAGCAGTARDRSGEALRAGGRDVVLAHHLEHARARVAQERGRATEREHQRRQGEVVEDVEERRRVGERVRPCPVAGKSLMPAELVGQDREAASPRAARSGTTAGRSRRRRPSSAGCRSWCACLKAEKIPSSDAQDQADERAPCPSAGACSGGAP